ncbi:MAG: trigger factor [Patescibacteria group bacterium]
MTMVKEEGKKGLARSFTITVPQDEVAAAMTRRLEEIAKKANIQGFRKGKAPLALIRQRFGAEAESEVLDRLINESVEKLLTEHSLRPAAQPKIELLTSGEGKDLSFKMDLEVLPAIVPMDFAKLSFTRQVADVSDKTVDEAVGRIAKSLRQPVAVTGARAAKMGDVVVLDFDGTVDGVAHPGMKAEGHKLELGSKSFIEGFEEQLVGLKVGDKKDVKVTFPKEYHAAHLAGKKAVFAIEIKGLLEHKAVEMNDELGKEVGFPSLAKLRERIADDIGNNYAQISRAVLKRELMDALAKAHKFELPETMTNAEFESIWQKVLKDKVEGRLDADDAKKSDDALKADYRDIAERRVRLGLLLAHVAEENKIEVTPVELRNAMMAEARRYPGKEQAVIDYYSKTRGAIEHLRAPILEEKVVDFILAKANVSEKKIDADALLKLPGETD